MRLSTTLAIFLVFAPVAYASGESQHAAPAIFAPDSIAGVADDGAGAFTPDGTTVYFMRGTGDRSTVMESHDVHGHWSTPRAAPFSGQWRDIDPAMAPDGSFLLFVSNRPAEPGGTPIDAIHAGQRRTGHGMNLWRVNRRGNGWGAPVRLPDIVNACSTTFAPSIAADGSIYFIGCAGSDDGFHLLRATYRNGNYQSPSMVKLGDADAKILDPAIAADGTFMVFSIGYDLRQPLRLAIAFRTPDGWSAPHDLGDAVNGGKHSLGSQIGPDQRTLYFYSDRRLPASDPRSTAAWNNGADHIWQISLAPWLDAAQAARH